jgi:hypothetical protein
MVILVLSAMAGASKILQPFLNNVNDENMAERDREISKYLLLNDGTPAGWGQNGQEIPSKLGLANAGSDVPYDLDIDKVSRLNSENSYALNYSQIFTALQIPDAAFRIEIRPIFEVTINPTATFALANDTLYQFEILTTTRGTLIDTELMCYVIAENHIESYHAFTSNGKIDLNVTLSNDTTGPALLVALAQSVFDAKIASFNTYTFTHNSTEPRPAGTFLRLSPLNYSLDVAFKYPELNLSTAYSVAFNYNSTLTQTAISNESATYSITRFQEASPTIVVVTGRNATTFFTEWVAYPQLPVQMGADLVGSTTLSSTFAYTYIVSVNSLIYQCTIWVGGPRQ